MIPNDTEILSLISSVRAEIQSIFSGFDLPESALLTFETELDVKPHHIDHTLLKATATSQQIEAIVQEAIQYGFASVCVNGRWVETVAQQLEGTAVKTCAVVGFPLGAMSSKVKAIEARTAVADGASEIDMVLSIGDVLSQNWMLVYQDVHAVVEAVSDRAIVKVILETGYLSDGEIIAASLVATMAGAKFVKTSTGFVGSGATVHHVALMKRAVGDSASVKASGGIRTSDVARQMLFAGASRLGASRGPDLLD